MGSTKVTRQSIQSVVISLVVSHYGGDKNVANKVYGDPSLFYRVVNWRSRGKVPLKEVLIVSERLGVSPFALNYKEYSEQQRISPPWSELIASTPLSSDTKKLLMQMIGG